MPKQLENPCELCGQREALNPRYCGGVLCGPCGNRVANDVDAARDLAAMRGWEHPNRPYRGSYDRGRRW